MTAAAYADFYAGVYRPLVSAFHGRVIDAVSVEDDQRPYADRLADVLRPVLAGRNGAAILDVGGSTGVVSERIASALQMRAVVLDPAPDEVARARARGVEGIVGTIETWAPDGEGFELVLLCQTIDHLLDVSASLAGIRQAITDNGILFVDIVDFRAAYTESGSIEAATKIDHPYSLTQATVEAFLARAGFEVAFKDFSPDHLHVGYVCRPVTPVTDSLPSAAAVAEFFRDLEILQGSRQ